MWRLEPERLESDEGGLANPLLCSQTGEVQDLKRPGTRQPRGQNSWISTGLCTEICRLDVLSWESWCATAKKEEIKEEYGRNRG